MRESESYLIYETIHLKIVIPKYTIIYYMYTIIINNIKSLRQQNFSGRYFHLESLSICQGPR